jgi:FkbM family methyltransferase
MQYVLRPGHGDDRLMTDEHEYSLVPIFQSEWHRVLQTETWFVDVGAHVGHWTVRAAAIGVRVLAIEPQDDVRKALYENLRVNGCAAPVVILPFAAWDSEAHLNLDLPTRLEARDQPPHVYGSTPQQASASVTIVRRPTPLSVPALPLDLMLERYASSVVPGFVKIDVEGAEAHVLRGMEMTLKEHHPHLLIEMHDCYYGADIADEVITFVKKIGGYKWAAIRERTWPHWYLHAVT